MYYENSEKMDSNMEIAFPDPCSYNIISSSKCEECVLKFVSYLFVTPGMLKEWTNFLNYDQQIIVSPSMVTKGMDTHRFQIGFEHVFLQTK